MGATHEGVDTPESKHVYKLAVSLQGKGEEVQAIRVRHLGKDGSIISECMLTPEDAYTYAKTILEAYDEAAEIE